MRKLFVLIAVLGISASSFASTIYSCGAPVLKGATAGLLAPVYSIVITDRGVSGQSVLLNEIVGVGTKAPYGRTLLMAPIESFGAECPQYQAGSYIARFCLVSSGRKGTQRQTQYNVQLLTTDGASAQCGN